MRKIFLVFSITLMFSSVFFCGCRQKDYKSAKQMMINKNYEEARNAFHSLGEYRDSKELEDQCCYSMAMDFYEKGQYKKAADSFLSLGDYPGARNFYKQAITLHARTIISEEKNCDTYLAFRPFYEQIRLSQNPPDIGEFLAGKWISDEYNAELEIRNEIESQLSESYNLKEINFKEILEDCGFDKIVLQKEIVFSSDGTYISYYNVDTFSVFYDQMKTAVLRAWIVMCEKFFYETYCKPYGVPLSHFLEHYSVKDVIELRKKTEDYDMVEAIDALYASEESIYRHFFYETGTFFWENGKLTLVDSQNGSAYIYSSSFNSNFDSFGLVKDGNSLMYYRNSQ